MTYNETRAHKASLKITLHKIVSTQELEETRNSTETRILIVCIETEPVIDKSALHVCKIKIQLSMPISSHYVH